MTMTDPIADYLTRIRNAVMAHHVSLEIPGSRVKEQLTVLLKEEGFIRDFKTITSRDGHPALKIFLKYGPDGERVVSGLERVSRPGRRVYVNSDEIPRILGGLGITILTTSRGMMTGERARRERLGGEIICNVW